MFCSLSFCKYSLYMLLNRTKFNLVAMIKGIGDCNLCARYCKFTISGIKYLSAAFSSANTSLRTLNI